MASRVTYRLEGPVATITMDDGKMNVMSPGMLAELNGALDQAEADHAIVVLTGREGVFSAGFDLNVLRSGGEEARAMVEAGYRLLERILSFPRPVVIGCSGHAIAMGVFILLSADHRIGAAGPFKIGANEVAIGLMVPRVAVEVCRQRLAPAHFNRAVVTAEMYPPEAAVAAGFLDRVVEPSELPEAVQGAAAELAKLDLNAHAATKLRAREGALTAVREAIEADVADLRARF